MLFARSIEENVKIGKLDASDAEVEQALDLAQADEFVARQSDGLGTIVGERGRSLSGGERQRLSIARALLKDPPIMIFDEATSALDVETERQLQLAMARATKGRTTFIIAHRLATVRNADRIFVFDRGRIVEQRQLRRSDRSRRPLRQARQRAKRAADAGIGFRGRLQPRRTPRRGFELIVRPRPNAFSLLFILRGSILPMIAPARSLRAGRLGRSGRSGIIFRQPPSAMSRRRPLRCSVWRSRSSSVSATTPVTSAGGRAASNGANSPPKRET